MLSRSESRENEIDCSKTVFCSELIEEFLEFKNTSKHVWNHHAKYLFSFRIFFLEQLLQDFSKQTFAEAWYLVEYIFLKPSGPEGNMKKICDYAKISWREKIMSKQKLQNI